ncbi:MAG: tetrahydromethanopterin S-methyltransferase subunit H [Candidatus Thermoplasmatota archaeon]
MFNFEREQKTFSIKGIKIGGQPGERATVLIGTIFYPKQLKELGKEERKKVENLILKQIEMEELTKKIGLVDVFIGGEDDVRRNIDFFINISDRPFLIDSPDPKVIETAVNYVNEIGIIDRVICNSINIGTVERCEKLEGLKSAILLLYNPKDLTTEGRLSLLENGGGIINKGLIEIATEIGIENILLDPAITPFEHSVGEALRSLVVLKAKYCYPVGCSIHNLVASWLWLKRYEDKKKIFDICSIGSNAIPQLLGSDFILYGPIEKADKIFPYSAMVDIILSEASDYFGIKSQKEHPRWSLR